MVIKSAPKGRTYTYLIVSGLVLLSWIYGFPVYSTIIIFMIAEFILVIYNSWTTIVLTIIKFKAMDIIGHVRNHRTGTITATSRNLSWWSIIVKNFLKNTM